MGAKKVMELVASITGLRYSEAFSPWLEMRNVIRNIGEKPSAEIEGPPLVLDIRDKKQRVVLRIKGFEFIQEGRDSVEDSINIAVDKLVELNSVSKLYQISQIWYESIFIEPYALPFHEILLLMKNRFLKPNTLVNPTTDIGLLFDQIEGDVFKHSQLGPMVKEQLLGMYLIYERDKLPDNFIFMSLRYQQNKNLVFNADYVQKFLQDAGQWQRDQAQAVVSYLKKGEG